MDRDRLLGMLSAAQLGCGLAGMAIAVRRGHAYDILWFHGRPEQVRHDAVGMGTALSAPLAMLVAQTALTGALLASRPGLPATLARRALGVLGAAMVPGYLGERHVRRRLARSGWDPLETPLVVAGAGLAAAMAALGGRFAGAGPGFVTGRDATGRAPAR